MPCKYPDNIPFVFSCLSLQDAGDILPVRTVIDLLGLSGPTLEDFLACAVASVGFVVDPTLRNLGLCEAISYALRRERERARRAAIDGEDVSAEESVNAGNRLSEC